MTFRVFKGNVLSLNGWRMCNEDECNWIIVRGTNPTVSLEIRKGIPTIILGEFAARFNEVIEQLRDPDSACWTLDNDVATSQHPAGVACDFNWNTHPFHAYGTFGDKLPALRHLLDVEFKGCVGWGGDWGGNPQDEMHFEIAYQEGYLDDNGNFVLDVDQRLIDLANEIQAKKPKTAREQHILDTIAEGQRLGISPRGIKIALCVEIVESNITMYANANDGASMALPHEAVGSDYDSSGLYQQRPPWGSIECRMDATCSTNLFFTVDHGPGVRGLTKIRDENGDLYDYNDESNSPGFYAQKVQGSAFPDRYDQHFQEASDLYDQYVNQTSSAGDDFMAELSSQEQRLMFDRVNQTWGALFNPNPSQSRYADPKDTWATKDFIRNDDGFLFDLITEHDASLGDSKALARIQKAAAGGDAMAQHFLDKLTNPVAIAQVLQTSPGEVSIADKAASVVAPANDLTCWQCGKAYPSVLDKCPFCGAAHEPPAEVPAAVEVPALDASKITNGTLTQYPTIPVPHDEALSSVIKELTVLQQFSSQLPNELVESVGKLLPILKGWNPNE